MHQLHRAKAEDIQAWLPFKIVSDGKMLATVLGSLEVHHNTHRDPLLATLDNPDCLGDTVTVRERWLP